MNTWELAVEIVDFVKMVQGALTDEKLTEEIDRIIQAHVSTSK